MAGVWDSITGIFGNTPVPGGSNVQNPADTGSSISSFFGSMLQGAERGTAQAFSGSDAGQKLQGFLTQGQSQLFAQNLFGNPAIMLATIGLVVFALVVLTRRA